ncbi:MAG: DUF2764 family protein [Desulfovermiculus sp.]|nr:DUF2764 family protein [Desulfovermiculus sp.]
MRTYLAASLPMCTLGQTPPMSLEELSFQCTGVLSADELQDLELLLHNRFSEGRTAFGRAWSALATQMDNEMAALRAQRWQIHPPSPSLHQGFSLEVSRVVHEAFSRETPLEMEWTLDQGRWKMAGELISPERPLGLERILAFGIQLQLMHRWAALDADTGREQLNTLLEGLINNILTEGESSA